MKNKNNGIIEIFILIVCSLIPTYLSAGLLDDLKDLKGMVVLEAGDVEQVECPWQFDYEKSDRCLDWPDLYKIGSFPNEYCFSPTIFDSCSLIFSCKGILAVDENKKVHFFEIEQMADTNKWSIELYECPSLLY